MMGENWDVSFKPLSQSSEQIICLEATAPAQVDEEEVEVQENKLTNNFDD